MTAIAAVIALTSTPSLAQSVETTPPIVDTAPAPSVPDPLAAEPTADPTVTTSPEPVASETTTVAPAATARSTTRAARPVARTTTRTTATRSTSAARPVAAAPVAATSAIEAPVAPLPIAPEAAVAAPVAPMVEPAPVAAPATDSVTIDQALPIAGAAGLGLLALLGGGMVMRRRRRREEDALAQAKREQIDAAAEPMIEPAPAPTFVRPPQADPVPVAAAVVAASELPAGFDVSRFGPHVQAAYRGPTPDNPSVSLKRRLTVGHFLDKEEVAAAPAAAEPSPSEAASVPATKPAWAARPDGDFMFRRDDKQPGLRPTFVK